jgi:RNA polymerase sigma-70 factor (ECF subfamily)
LLGPETRASLLASLNDPASEEAWAEFAAIYRPLVLRVAMAKGLQHADAEDLAQEVLTVVGRVAESFTSRGSGSFRAWLFRITRNRLVNHLTRSPAAGRKGLIGSGDSEVRRMLHEQPTGDNETVTLFRLEYRRARFEVAAEKLRGQFSESVWKSFWMTAVDGQSIESVAEQLDKSTGAVRVARCRVLSRLREEVKDDSLNDDITNIEG